MTYGQLRDALYAAIVAQHAEDADDDEGYWYAYVADFSDTYVIWSEGDGQYLQDNYVAGADGVVTLAGTPIVVKPSTTYVPTGDEVKALSEMERRGAVFAPDEVRLREAMSRGISLGMGSPVDSVEQAVRAAILGNRPESFRVKSEPLTYRKFGPHSYFRDLAVDFVRQDRGALDRLQRHAAEMEVVTAERDKRALAAARAGDFEFRTEPNTTDGTGGYFTIPLWMDELFAAAKRPGAVLSALIPGKFPLPMGVASINVPILTTGTSVAPQIPNAPVSKTSIVDSLGTANVVTFSGQSDQSMQLLEQSPLGAALDWVIGSDLAADYARDLEVQLLNGGGSSLSQMAGVIGVGTTVTYTDSSPTGTEMFPYFGQAAAAIGKNRKLPPEAFLMTTARWAWLTSSEDTNGLPFVLASPFFLGDDPDTPDPQGGLLGWPVFLDDAIPTNLGAGANQDTVIGLRPSDLLLFEAQPITKVMDQPLSGNLGVRIQMHARAAAVTNRYPAGIYYLSGTGMVPVSGF